MLGEPTKHLPGTPEKVAVIESRAALGLALWHPDDARVVGEQVRDTLPLDPDHLETISVREWHRIAEQTVLWDPDWLPRGRRKKA